MAGILFYLLSALALLGGAGVVLARSPMISVLSLLASFFALAVIYLLIGFQFLAAVQILVYAGAILVLFLFVIMLLDLGHLGRKVELETRLFSAPRARLALVVAAALGLVGLIAAQRAAFAGPSQAPAAPAVPPEGLDPLGPLALELFGRYSLPFEAASLLLLATMVAVMLLAKRQRSGRRPALGRPPRRTEVGR